MPSSPPFSSFELKESFVRLDKAMKDLYSHITSRREAPFSLAPHLLTDTPHEFIANTLCNLFYPVGKHLIKLDDAAKAPPPYGVLAIDDEGAALIEIAQQAKSNFFEIASSINAYDHGVKRGMASQSGRGTAIQEALAGQGLRQLWLQQCYRRLHLIEEEPFSISFTWQRSHSARVPLTLDKAIELAQSKRRLTTETEMERDIWVNTLKSVDLERFRIVKVKKEKAAQLKANIAITPGRGGKKLTLSSPTIILVKSAKLPKINYRSIDEINSKSVTRKDKVFSEEFALGFLNLYKLPVKLPKNEGFEEPTPPSEQSMPSLENLSND